MLLKNIRLSSFRNYQSLDIGFGRDINVLVGSNAQGKTNFLEALYLLGTLKSFRVRQEGELLEWGAPSAAIKAVFECAKGPDLELEVRWARSGSKVERRILRDSVVSKRVGEFLHAVPIVLFVPQDLALVQQGPALRRRFFDVLLCKVSSEYYRTLVEYQHIVRQRCELLRRGRTNVRVDVELDVWDEQFAERAVRLVQLRLDMVKRIGQAAHEMNSFLSAAGSGLPQRLELTYSPTLPEQMSVLRQSLKNRRGLEVSLGQCTIGPHRDDIDITIDGKSLKAYGSQGQQRTAALALRLAEASIMSDDFGESSIVLLDDCFSELDEMRCQRLLDYLRGTSQVFITSAAPISYQSSLAVANSGSLITYYQVSRGLVQAQ